MKQFSELDLSKEILTTIQRSGLTQPTEIQEKSIPLIMAGKDLMGQSATGSGKTLAFGSGIIEHIDPKRGLQALVLTPTRELAEQVTGELKKLTGRKRLKIISVYGGVSINPQIHDLAYAEVVVGTPGRLLDHLERRTINTSKIKLLVLDEADRMLDMGFIDDVEKIIRTCPERRQTLFFSATTSTSIRRLINKHMHNPIEVSASKLVDPSKLKQVYYNVTRNTKLSLLVHLLKNENSGLVMVFCNTRRTTDFIVKNLRANGVKAIATHGGLSQNKRTRSIDMFNNAKAGILVCTDVAARGLHIDNVSHIYNYEIPKDPKDYVHRIGRTARAGEKGKVVNLLSEENHGEFGRIQAEYRTFVIQRMESPHVERITIRSDASRGPRRFFGRGNFRNDRGSSGGFRGRSSSGGGFRSRSSSGGDSRGGSFRSRSSRSESSPGRSSGFHKKRNGNFRKFRS